MADQEDTNTELEDAVSGIPPEDIEDAELTEADGDPENALNLDDLGVTGEDGENLLAMEDDIEPMRNAKDLEAVYDIPVQLSAVLGKAQMQVSQLLKLGRGAVVELDRKVGEAIDIYVNNRLVARGEVVVVEERLGVTMTEIIKSDRVN